MEKQLRIALMLSLKDIALRKVSVLLWNAPDVLSSVSEFLIFKSFEEEVKKNWEESVEDKIKDKISKLVLPELLTQQMMQTVKPLSLQIRKWIDLQEHHLRYEARKIDLPNSAELCWTAAGVIDCRETAKALVRCDVLDVEERYTLACVNCLEDYIPLLWEKLPEERKGYFYKRGVSKKCYPPALYFCWPHILKGERHNLDYLWTNPCGNLTSFNQWAFEHSAKEFNKVAVEYFFQKLTPKEREASVMRTVEDVLKERSSLSFAYHAGYEIFCYLLSLISPEQQMEIVKKHPSGVLLKFLDCPWPDLFLENVGLFWTFLPPSCYGELSELMARRFEKSHHYFPKLFQEFFIHSPDDFKNDFVDLDSVFGNPAYRFLSIFFVCEDAESVEVIFRNVDAADRVKIVLYRRVLELFFESILKDKGHVVEVCLRELSKEDRKRLKEVFTEFLGRKVSGKCIDRKFKRFFEFFDEIDGSSDKEKKAQKRKLGTCCPE
ncbi:unnamed protein product [Larinioides sclopetarius]|uniref:Uncharacterized protein n=1 Tax=Larinioides sclopetarius TaxID=280406 RepID=A0AAV2BU01_9ARAC